MNTKNNLVTKRRGCLGCLGRGLVGLLALLVVVMIVGAIYQSAASASDLKKYPPPGQLYDVGEYRLHLDCVGEGSPTVILEAGAGSPGRVWYLVQEKVAEFTRVCSYDRPGFGWSDPASGPLGSEQTADILHQLLQTAGVPGPYVMVGHSAGGVLVREFTQKYQSEVVGMVLVDSSHESQNLRFPPEYLDSAKQKVMMYKACQALTPFGIVRMARLWHRMLPVSVTSTDAGREVLSTMYRSTAYCAASLNEEISFAEILSQPDGSASLGDLPLIALTADTTPEKMMEQVPEFMRSENVITLYTTLYEAGLEMQRELADLSSQGRQIMVKDSGHSIYLDQPDVVIDSIKEIVEQVHGE